MKVLVLMTILRDRDSFFYDAVSSLKQSIGIEVEVRTFGMGMPAKKNADFIYDLSSTTYVPKFVALNSLLSSMDYLENDFILVVDDDVQFSNEWLTNFLELQAEAGFDLAQPALSHDSFYSHPFTLKLHSSRYRRTEFVEIGPVFSVSRQAFAQIFPFPSNFTMGYGLDAVWSQAFSRSEFKMGIIDSCSIKHVRPVGKSYSAEQQRDEQLGLKLDSDVYHFHKVKSIFLTSNNILPRYDNPLEISVVVTSCDRPGLLKELITSLKHQDLDKNVFEIIIVDDGHSSVDDVVTDFFSDLQIVYLRQANSGLATARNVGISCASAPIVLMLDDDDLCDSKLLSSHIEFHRTQKDLQSCALSTTTYKSEDGGVSLMDFLVSKNGFLFSTPTQKFDLDFKYFWGGRTSFKRDFLIRYGLFNPIFRWGYEDIELGFRLQEHGLRVTYLNDALIFVNRDLTLEDFAQRSFRQGLAATQFLNLHRFNEILEYLTTVPFSTRINPQEVLPDLIDYCNDLIFILRHEVFDSKFMRQELEDKVVEVISQIYSISFLNGFFDRIKSE